MRILMLNFEYPPVGGGAATATQHVLQEFSRKKDVVIDLVTVSEGKDRLERIGKNIAIHRLDIGKKQLHHWTMGEFLKWTHAAKKKMKELHAQHDYDLCHCWFGWPPGVLGWRFRKQAPYIVGLRGSDVPGFSKRTRVLDPILFKPVSKTVWKHARKVIANSEGLRLLAQKTKNCAIDVIPNGVDTKKFTPGRALKNRELRLLYVGRLLERKGIDLVLNALSQITNAHLDIIGEGKQEAELKQLVEKLGLGKRVRFLGYIARDKLPRHYQQVDVFVLPSSNEGMSNTLLEAIASGLAVIVTNTGGTKELVKEGRDGNGIILKKRDAEEIIRAIRKLHNDKTLLKNMRARSRAIAQKHSWTVVAEQYHEVYRDAIE